jgi:Domain of unknown function (DUF4340)
VDRSQSTLLLVLSALVIAVATVLYVGGAAEGEGDPEATAKIFNVDPDGAELIRIERAAGRVVLEKVGDQWRVREPYDEVADPDQVRDLVDVLRNVRSGIPVATTADRAAEFGLSEPPNARVTFVGPDGVEHRLDVGFEAPAGYRTYVRDANGAVAAVNGDLNRPLQADVDRYRDPAVVRFEVGAVRQLDLPGPPPVIVLGEGDDWWLEGVGPADSGAVRDLLEALRELRFESSGGEQEPTVRPAPTVQLAASQWRLTLADGSSLAFSVGPPAPEGPLVRGDNGRVGRLPSAALDEVPHRVEQLIAENGFRLSVERSELVRVTTSDGASFEARRNGSAWQRAGADDGDTWTWVSALAKARVHTAVQPVPAERVALTVEVGEGEALRRIEVGPSNPDGTRSARDLATGSWYPVAGAAVDEVLAALAQR